MLFVATLVVATLLYLATKRPALAAILPCLHGGYETLRTGFWMLRSDPCRRRARTCFIAELGPIRSGMNYAIFVVVTAVVFPAVAVGALILAVFNVGQARNQLETLPAGIFTFVAIFGGPFAMIPVYAWLSSRIAARETGSDATSAIGPHMADGPNQPFRL